MKHAVARQRNAVLWLMIACLSNATAAEAQLPQVPPSVLRTLRSTCLDCHNATTTEGGLDLSALSDQLHNATVRQRWVRIHDRIQQREMPPSPDSLADDVRQQVVLELDRQLSLADIAEVQREGRGSMRRLNRDEFQQNLRDLLLLPHLDIRDMLPEDRESHHFNKTTATLDISRVQLTASLNAVDAALRMAVASGIQPPEQTHYRAVGRKLFYATATFGNREAMFFARHGEAINDEQLRGDPSDQQIELALFRSAHWPYYGYPQNFVATLSGRYRIRFSARSVRQLPGYKIVPNEETIAMTFRARKPSGADVSGDVRATGGILELQSEAAEYQTVIDLRAGETFEYSLLGLPVPLARNVDGGPPTYRYPPFPESGQPGAAFQWLEVDGPLTSEIWPPESHTVLFGELPIQAAGPDDVLPVAVVSQQPRVDATRLLQAFIQRAAVPPVPEEQVLPFERLVVSRLQQGVPFAEAVLAGYQAFLCSPHVLYLQEPGRANDHFAIASRLSYLLTNSRPDAKLLQQAQQGQLRDAQVLCDETDRLIHSASFSQFVNAFTDYWLNLRNIHRDEPDVRLYPEYRFHAWLMESMKLETQTFVQAMFQDNLPITTIVDSDFAFLNQTLARHYQLPAISGAALRQVSLPADSPYGGLLTQAAIMKVTANGTSTSPVVRGAWIMDRLLGQPPPLPPESVPAVEPDVRGASSIRELLALHAKSESCAECHARFDPVGMALENFDIWGQWRTTYRRLPNPNPRASLSELTDIEAVAGIDRAGHDYVYLKAGAIDAAGQLLNGKPFQDIHELKPLLLNQRRQLARNLLQQLTVFATGTPVRYADRGHIENILNVCEDDGYRVRDLLRDFIQSPIFLGPSKSQLPANTEMSSGVPK